MRTRATVVGTGLCWLGLSLTVACADTPAEPEERFTAPAITPLAALTDYEGETYPDNPDEPASISHAVTAVMLPSSGSDFGYVEAAFNFIGNNGSQTTNYRFASTAGHDADDIWEGEIVKAEHSCHSGWFCYTKRIYSARAIVGVPSCNISGGASSIHEAWWMNWVSLTPGGVKLLNATPRRGEASAHSVAPTERRTCSTGNGGGGGDEGGGSGGTMLNICTYLDHYDSNGNFIYTEHLGCRMEYVE